MDLKDNYEFFNSLNLNLKQKEAVLSNALGRYKDHIEALEEKFMSIDPFGLDLSFNTIHKVKGLESEMLSF